MKLWKHTIPIFRLQLYLVVHETAFKAYDLLPASTKKRCEKPEHEDCAAATVYDRQGGLAAILLCENPTHDQIAHEVHHVVGVLADYIGAKDTPVGAEWTAYPCDYITDWVYRKLGREKSLRKVK